MGSLMFSPQGGDEQGTASLGSSSGMMSGPLACSWGAKSWYRYHTGCFPQLWHFPQVKAQDEDALTLSVVMDRLGQGGCAVEVVGGGGGH